MKKSILATAVFIMLSPCLSTAQEADSSAQHMLPSIAPAYDSIFFVVQDRGSRYYYPKLAKRFLRGDTTLDLQDVRCLYYGYPTQDNFNPYFQSEELETVSDIMRGDNSGAAEFKRAYKVAGKGLSKKPSDLALAYWKLIAAYYGFGENSKELNLSRLQFEQLQIAIASTGGGTAESPFFITSVGHSYMIMNIVGVKPQMQLLVYDTVHHYRCDVFPVVDEEGNEDTLYFEISQCLKFWDRDKDNETKALKQKKVRIEAGQHFVLRPRSIKGKNSKFDIVLMEPYNKPLSIHTSDSLFPESGDPGTIEGYFGHDADTTHTLLITKNRSSKAIDFDSGIYDYHAMQWQPTGNHGNWPGAIGVEMWPGRISYIDISNLRRKK